LEFKRADYFLGVAGKGKRHETKSIGKEGETAMHFVSRRLGRVKAAFAGRL
jgi:hypothetical protein